MKNENHFGTLTERMQAFREEVLDEKPYVDAERAIWATEAYRESLNQPRVMVRALMLQKILEHMTVYIDPFSQEIRLPRTAMLPFSPNIPWNSS